MKKSTIWAAGVAAVGALAPAACGAGGGGEKATSPSSTSVQEVKFWGWAPGYADAVKAFNASHPNIRVAYEEVRRGSKGGFEKKLLGALLSVIPLVVAFLCLQRFWRAGLTAGAVK